MEDLLSSAKEIDSVQYLDLKNPIFIGQSRPDSNNMYWVVYEDNGIMYKIHDTLYFKKTKNLIYDYPDESGDYDFYDDESNFMPDLGSK